MLIFGLRRGGRTYYALDVTTPTSPEILWIVDNDTLDFAELGQTWSTPSVGHLANGQIVAVFGAGYDENRDFDVTPDLVGRGVFMVDVFTGSLVWKHTALEDSNMDSSIPSDVAALDTSGNGYLDRLYVGGLDEVSIEQDVYYNWVIDDLGPGVNEVLVHPVADGEEVALLGERAERRVEDFRIVMEPGTREAIDSKGIVLVGYKPILELVRRKSV